MYIYIYMCNLSSQTVDGVEFLLGRLLQGLKGVVRIVMQIDPGFGAVYRLRELARLGP